MLFTFKSLFSSLWKVVYKLSAIVTLLDVCDSVVGQMMSACVH